MSEQSIAEYREAAAQVALKQAQAQPVWNRPPDVRVENYVSCVILRPLTDDAEQWIKDNISRTNGYQPYYPAVICNHAYVDAILIGMERWGLIIAS